MSTRPITPTVRAGATAIVAAVLLVLALAGCSGNNASRYLGGGGDTEDPMTPEQQFAQLMQRPDLEQAYARHIELLDKLTTRLRTELGTHEWTIRHDRAGQNGCAGSGSLFNDVDLLDAGVKKTPNYVVGHAITAEQWPTAKTTVTTISSEYGFTPRGLAVERPSDYIINLSDHYGATLNFGSGNSTVAAITSGCHLYPQAKQRGTPTLPRTY